MHKIIERLEISNDGVVEAKFVSIGEVRDFVSFDDRFIRFNNKLYRVLSRVDLTNDIIVAKSNILDNKDIPTYSYSMFDLRCCFCGEELGLEHPNDDDEEECETCFGKQRINIEYKFTSTPIEPPVIKQVK